MMEGGTPVVDRRCCSVSRPRCFGVILLLAAMLFFYTNFFEMRDTWSPRLWQHYNETKWWLHSKFKGPYYRPITANTDDLDNTYNATTNAVEVINETSSPFITSTEAVQSTETSTDHTQHVAMVPTKKKSAFTERTMVNRAVMAPPVPYVSPGLYTVEYPYEYHFTINEAEKCKQSRPFAVLMVPVAPHVREHRDTIRRTWGGNRSVLGKAVLVFFLLGQSTGEDAERIQQQVLKESREHRDVLQSDFVDCYKNLTIKTMVMLEWLGSYCSDASYAMKIDSDMFLNVPNLIKLLLNAPKENYLTGLVAHGAPVLRDPTSKWYLPTEVFPAPQYPPYALGLGYILSLDLAGKLVEASRHVQNVYIEDVYVGLCMRYLNISPTNAQNWNQFHVMPVPYNRCAYSKIIATTTLHNADRVSEWNDFNRTGSYC